MFGRDSGPPLVKLLFAVQVHQTVVSQALLFVVRTSCSWKQVLRSSGRVLRGTGLVSSCGPLLRSEKSGDLEL